MVSVPWDEYKKFEEWKKNKAPTDMSYDNEYIQQLVVVALALGVIIGLAVGALVGFTFF